MKYEHKEKYKVDFSSVDFNLRLGIINACYITQNMVTEYFSKYNFDNSVICNRNNAVLVVLKHKLHFNRFPNFNEEIEALSYTTKKSSYLFEMETGFTHNDEELFYCKSEICPVDISTRVVKKLEDIGYPADMDTAPCRYKENAKRNTIQFTEDDFSYEEKMHPTEIDYSGHVNNVSYIKFLINTMPVCFYRSVVVTDMEILYIHEAFEGELIRIYKKEINDNQIAFLIKRGDTELTRAVMTFKSI